MTKYFSFGINGNEMRTEIKPMSNKQPCQQNNNNCNDNKQPSTND